MKYCSHCGKEIADEAVVCIGCGCAVPNTQINTTSSATDTGEKKTKFCSHCGKEIDNNAVICIGCGCAVPNYKQKKSKIKNILPATTSTSNVSGLKTAALVLSYISIATLALGSIIILIYLIDLYASVTPALFQIMLPYYIPYFFSCLIPLAWGIPMVIVLSDKIKNEKPISTGFKICTLLFVNTVAGILLLCDKEQDN